MNVKLLNVPLPEGEEVFWMVMEVFERLFLNEVTLDGEEGGCCACDVTMSEAWENLVKGDGEA